MAWTDASKALQGCLDLVSAAQQQQQQYHRSDTDPMVSAPTLAINAAVALLWCMNSKIARKTVPE